MRFRKKGAGFADADLTPMIDMTFQLIAFFMVLINFTESEQDDRIKLPESELAKPPDSPMENQFTVHLTKQANCIIGGQILPLASARVVLLREAKLIEARNENIGDATIIIRGHAKASTGSLQELIKLCQDARFEKFVLRAKEKQEY